MTKKKIVLAYSGGLDTSVLVRILREDYGYDVVACHVVRRTLSRCTKLWRSSGRPVQRREQ